MNWTCTFLNILSWANAVCVLMIKFLTFLFIIFFFLNFFIFSFLFLLNIIFSSYFFSSLISLFFFIKNNLSKEIPFSVSFIPSLILEQLNSFSLSFNIFSCLYEFSIMIRWNRMGTLNISFSLFELKAIYLSPCLRIKYFF